MRDTLLEEVKELCLEAYSRHRKDTIWHSDMETDFDYWWRTKRDNLLISYQGKEKERLSPEDNYNEFWKEIVEKNGELDLNQIKKELSDYSFILDQLPKIYCHVTGGLLSKHMYFAGTIIQVFEERQSELFEDLLKDELEGKQLLGDGDE